MYLCLFSRFDRRALEWSNTGATGLLMYRVYRKYTVKRAFVIPLGEKIPLVHRCPPPPHPTHNFTTTKAATTTNTLPTGSSLAEEYTWATDSETLSTSDNRPHHDEGAVPEENGGLGELRTMIIVDRQHTAYIIPVIAAESRSFALLLHQIDYQTRTRRADIISSFKPCGHLLHSLEAQYTVLQQ